MADEFKRAETLREVAVQTQLEPLALNDPRYADLCAGRSTPDLRQMRVHIQDFDASQNRYAWVALVGHRGGGKTTELYRLEKDLSPRFTPVHLFVEDIFLSDFDFTDMLLWTVEELARKFAQDPSLGTLSASLLEDVAAWFAERCDEKVQTIKSEVEASAGAEIKARLGLLGLGIGMFARLKSILKGSMVRRQTARQNLRRYASELVEKVNLVLDEAAGALKKAGRSPDLLIVQDNLDRLQPLAARQLFFDDGEFLKRLHAHSVYTAPIGMVLSPWNIGRVFDNVFTMPNVKTHDSTGKAFGPGLKALENALERRVVMDKVFSGKAARELAKMSGGSVRDLLRLLNYANLDARTGGKSVIDLASVKAAAGKMRVEYERLLIPGATYYPFLAEIYRTKHDALKHAKADTPDAVAARRAFLCELLLNGSVLEYDGGSSWLDVHPVVQEIPAFQNALKKLK
jgi:hypothetical protein